MTLAKTKPRPLAKHRAGRYPALAEQLGAIWKILDVIAPHLPAEALDAVPRDALDVWQAVAEVKERFPKRPRR